MGRGIVGCRVLGCDVGDCCDGDCDLSEIRIVMICELSLIHTVKHSTH